MKVTTPGVGYAPGYCDPWWYVCYPGGFVPVENIVGERSSTDFGMDFGGGVRFGPVFAELRYHYIWGPTIEGQEVAVNPLPANPSSTSSLVGESQQSVSRHHLRLAFGGRSGNAKRDAGLRTGARHPAARVLSEEGRRCSGLVSSMSGDQEHRRRQHPRRDQTSTILQTAVDLSPAAT
jgi:hypothetical protein